MQKVNKFKYTLWEDYNNGMYNNTKNEENDIKKALIIFKDFNRFDSLCKKVIENWRVSCVENLTNKHINRVAWIGQASLNIVDFIPGRITKKCWKLLDSETQNKLNKIAYNKILEYERNDKYLCEKVGKSLF